MKNIVRALALTGILGAAAAAAQAQVGISIGVRTAPVVADVQYGVPPCPGDGYVWQPGYYVGSMWYPGQWVYAGYGYAPRYDGGYRVYDPGYRVYDRDDYRYRDHDDYYRHEYREHDRGWDHDRGEHRGWDRH